MLEIICSVKRFKRSVTAFKFFFLSLYRSSVLISLEEKKDSLSTNVEKNISVLSEIVKLLKYQGIIELNNKSFDLGISHRGIHLTLDNTCQLSNSIETSNSLFCFQSTNHV
jgi:hypothetical protein